MKDKVFRKDTPKRILVIHTDGNTFNNPSLKCIIDLLLEKGFKIDLRYPRSHAPMPFINGVRLISYGRILRRLKSIIFDRFCMWQFIFLSVFLEKQLLYKKYDLIIGVDRQGLIEASVLNKITATPYIFISFEIMFESETSTRYKSLEQEASKGVAFWLIQDEVRAQQLQYENNLQPVNRILLPLASAGIGILKMERLRDHLGIPKDKKVAIIIGSVSGWTMADQILKAVVDWPDDWVLIVHDRYGRTRESLGEALANIEGLQQKVFISDAATERVDDMGSILAGISVGFAFYEPNFNSIYTGKNLKYLGFSSGKISTYLRYGVPVILNEIGLYAQEAQLFRFGLVVQRPEQIKDNLEEVCHEEYRNNARDYFAKKLDFNLYGEEVLYRILSSMNYL